MSSTKTVFQRELLADLWPELDPLLERHYLELAHYQDIPLEVDKGAYHAMEQHDMVRMFTMRDAGRLVGYACFFVRRNLHYRSSKQAVQDVIWIAPECRGNGDGARFIAACDAWLAAEQVQVVYHHVKPVHPQLAGACLALGYELVDNIYGKRLDQHGSLGSSSAGSGGR